MEKHIEIVGVLEKITHQNYDRQFRMSKLFIRENKQETFPKRITFYGHVSRKFIGENVTFRNIIKSKDETYNYISQNIYVNPRKRLFPTSFEEIEAYTKIPIGHEILF